MTTTSPSSLTYTDAPEFFSVLFEGAEGLLELRSLPLENPRTNMDSYVSRTFLSTLDTRRRVRFCRQHINRNTYFGCSTRDGHGGETKNLVSLPMLYVDIDFKMTPLEVFKKNFEGFSIQPTACVNSGWGLHLYWKLREALTKDDIPALEDMNKRIASHLGGDMGSTDAARVLRVPGTWNTKYSPVRPVTLGFLNKNAACELNDFDFLPDAPKQAALVPGGNGDKWICEALLGVPAGARHPTGIKLAGFFLSRGVPVDVVQSILGMWNDRNKPPLSGARLTELMTNIRRYEEPSFELNGFGKCRATD